MGCKLSFNLVNFIQLISIADCLNLIILFLFNGLEFLAHQNANNLSYSLSIYLESQNLSFIVSTLSLLRNFTLDLLLIGAVFIFHFSSLSSFKNIIK